MEEAFRIEKQRNVELKEKIKANEEEYDSIFREIKLLQSKKNVTYITKNGGQIDLSKISMSIDDMVRYKQKVLIDCENA